MQGLTQPDIDDLIDCLTTLTQFDGGPVPETHLDLYYHARDLAEELDDSADSIGGLAFRVKHRAFEKALETAQTRTSAQ